MHADSDRPLTRSLSLFAVLICAIYLVGVFPFAFFRHDDWLILGNAVVRMTHDWSFAWRTSLYFHDRPSDWFFRPFFKLGTYLFFRLYGFRYELWLATLLAIEAGGVALGALVVRELTGSLAAAALFVFLFGASAHLHFANTVWVGEGMMNSPQILLLAASALALCRALGARHSRARAVNAGLCALAFTLSLGFKESSALQIVWLAAVALGEPRYRAVPWRARCGCLAPTAGIAAGYLVWRLFLTPINPSYAPALAPSGLLRPAALFAAAIAVPSLAWLAVLALRGAAGARAFLVRLAGKAAYAPYFALVFLPYLGHPFFSPGWFALPGFFFLLVIASASPAGRPDEPGVPTPASLWRAAVFILLVGTLSVAWETCRIQWWSWYHGQREILTLFQQADGRVRRIELADCTVLVQPELSRVVGSPESLEQLWLLLHGTPARVVPVDCWQRRNPATDVLSVRWRFPHFSLTAAGRS
jgi:hypothetical protein